MTPRAATTLRVLAFLLVSPIILIAASPLNKASSPEVGLLLVGMVTSILTFLLTALFVRWDGLSLKDVGAKPDAASPLKILLGFLMGLSIVAVQSLTIYAGGRTHWFGLATYPSAKTVLTALAGYFVLALREEIAFRGYPLRRLESAWGMWLSLLIVGIIFSLEHKAGGMSWSRSLLGPFVGALLFGMAALATRGIALPLGIHSAFNFGQWLIGQKETAGMFAPVVDKGFERQTETLGYIGYFVAVLLATAGLWFWKKKSSPALSA